jgi:hypothetical protein
MTVGGKSGPVVIAITSNADERVRLARLVDGYAPLLLVSSRQEARAFLDGYQSALPADEPPREAATPSPAPQPLAQRGSQRESQRVTRRPRQVSHAGLRVDSDRHTVCWAGHETALTPLEHDLLACMLAEPDLVWSFARLHQQVWGTQFVGAGSDVHSLVKRVRRKLARMGTPVGIDAIRGVGFRLSCLGNGEDAPPAAAAPPVVRPVEVPEARLAPESLPGPLPGPLRGPEVQSEGESVLPLVKPATG